MGLFDFFKSNIKKPSNDSEPEVTNSSGYLEPNNTNSIAVFANNLISEFKTTGTAQGLRAFYNQSRSHLDLTLDNSSSENLKNIGTLYFIMLQDDTFEDDPDERQLMAGIGYYVLSLGVNLNCDKIGIPNNPSEWIEFLKMRIHLLLHSEASIQFSLRMRTDREIDPNWTPLSDNPYRLEKEALTKMIISDAAEINRWLESDLMLVAGNIFQKEALKLAKQIISDNSWLIKNSSLDDYLYSGKEVHKSLFSFFESRFNNKKSITASELEDDYE